VGDLGATDMEVTSLSWSLTEPQRVLDCPCGVGTLSGGTFNPSIVGFRRPSQLPNPGGDAQRCHLKAWRGP